MKNLLKRFLFRDNSKTVNYLDEVKVIRTQKRSKTITVRLKNGVIEVLCPLITPEFLIKNILKKKKKWINSKVQEYSTNSKNLDLFEKGFVKFKGTNLRLVFREGLTESVIHKEDILKFGCNSNTIKDKKKLVVKWLTKESEIFLKQRIKMISKKIGIKFKSLKIKSYTGRWGSCDLSGEICLNWKLIMLDEDIIDYVIIHELSHIIFPNHSQNFWNLVGEKDPNYLKKKDWLKGNGSYFIRF